MRVIGMISSGYDSELTESAAMSLRKACDKVYILDGPIKESERGDYPTNLGFALEKDGFKARQEHIAFDTDADKRTALLKWTQHENGPDSWAVVLDSDELLIWPEFLRDFLRLAEKRPLTSAGGYPLRLVEFDGSVALVSSRIYKLHAVEKYNLSVHTITLKGSESPIALPNAQVCYMHGIAMRSNDPRCRPPLQGEPHILHRTMLRDPERQAERQHEAEGRFFDERIPSGNKAL